MLTASDLSFVREQGILTAGEVVPRKELLFRLIDKKSAFEWQQGVLESSTPATQVRLLVGGQLKEFSLAPDALIYQRVGDSRLPLRKGSWIGGELVDFRAEGDVIPMLVYRINFANPAADRYSRLAIWQVHKTKAELDAAFRPLKIGDFSDMRVIQRGLSERLVSTEIIGTTGRATVPALRLRTLLSFATACSRTTRAQRSRCRGRRDLLRTRLGARRRHVPGGRVRHGAGGGEV